MINIQLFCVYHALLDFFWNVNRAYRNSAPSHFSPKRARSVPRSDPAVSAPCSAACAFVAIKQPKHTLRSFAAIKFAMYIATNLGRDCDVPRATLSSELVFVVAIG